MQITLTGNKISSTGGNQLVADLTGDGVGDISLGPVLLATFMVGANINGVTVYAGTAAPNHYVVRAGLSSGGVGTYSWISIPAASISYLNAVTFSDSRINGGASTGGWLQVNAFNTSSTNHTVELSRLIFDDANPTGRPTMLSIPGTLTDWAPSAIPEPSSLALLALGAGGLLARRRRAQAAA